ncbi:MAG: hpcD [Rickettsiaceae bacterium]|jgi:5-carboxymethyl-2-hydroxymuconate isomerase|nr:hpcD [Rickettsiaceae bacterium]
MPHIKFEYSSNIELKDINNHLEDIHITLAEMLPTKLENCKTRIIRHDDYFIGKGSDDAAFIHLNIKILPGRSEELLNAISEKILNHLKKAFFYSAKSLKLGISVSLEDLPKTYRKL